MANDERKVMAEFKISLPIEKSDRQDGWYLTGLASGLEPDLEGDAMSQSAIEMSARQINEVPLPFYDWHNKNSVLAELGEVTKAWVDENFNLGVEVKLDEDHYGAQTIWNKIQNKKKKFGMSIHGQASSYTPEVSKAGQRIRRINEVVLDEISLTTKPVWTPSFGTVLSKAIDEAEKSSPIVTGEDSPMAEETLVKADAETTAPVADSNPVTTEEASTPVVEETAVVEKSAPETTETEVDTTPVPAVPHTPENEPVEPVEVEKSVEENKIDAKKLAALVEMHRAQAALLTELGLIDGVVTASTDKPVEPTVEKSEKVEDAAGDLAKTIVQVAKDTHSEEIAELRKALDELRERVPERGAPGVLIRKSDQEELDEFIEKAQADPSRALRFALAASHNEGDKFKG